MGTNIFTEGRPNPVLIKVRLTRGVDNFSELQEVSSALASVDQFLYRDWRRLWPSFGSRRYREMYLTSFSKHSPPEFMLFSDPAWIAVFLMFIIGYKSLKANIPEIAKDIRSVLSNVIGLTGRQLELLEIAIRLSLERLGEETPKNQLNNLLRKFQRIYERLTGDSEEPPQINIVDIDEFKDRY